MVDKPVIPESCHLMFVGLVGKKENRHGDDGGWLRRSRAAELFFDGLGPASKEVWFGR